MTKNWMENARIALACVASVVGEKVNAWPQYVSARTQLLGQRERLYNNALRALLYRMTSADRASCRRRMVALVRAEEEIECMREEYAARSLTGGAVL